MRSLRRLDLMGREGEEREDSRIEWIRLFMIDCLSVDG